MRLRRWVSVMILIGLVVVCSFAFAQPRQTLEVEATSWIVSSQGLPVGDEAGHSIGIQKREGSAVFRDGQTAQYSTVSNFDFRRGRGGTSSGYSKFTFDDGSTLIFSWTAAITVGADGLSLNKGKGTIIQGTGKFAGIKGTSVFSGRQLKPAAEGPKGTAVQQATIQYTLTK